MRPFKCRPFYEFEVDLDDPKTYEHLPDTTGKLFNLMMREIGYAYWYMNFHMKDAFNCEVGIRQKLSIEKLIAEFTTNRRENIDNVMWHKEQVFLFQDETENMC